MSAPEADTDSAASAAESRLQRVAAAAPVGMNSSRQTQARTSVREMNVDASVSPAESRLQRAATAAPVDGDFSRQALARTSAREANTDTVPSLGAVEPQPDAASDDQEDQPMNVAFTVRLSPAAATIPEEARATPHTGALQASAMPEPAASSTQDNARAASTATARGKESKESNGRERPATAEAARPPAADADPSQTLAGTPQAGDARAANNSRAAGEIRQTARDAEPASGAWQPDRDAAGEPIRPAEARNINLQVGRDENRVEVRLTERAGQVHVAVRTPDSRLAGDLREELPALTSRLEQSGFRTEAWRPASSTERGEGWSRGTETSAASAGESQSQHSGQQQQEQQRETPQRKEKDPQDGSAAAQARKDFAWLLSSLS